MPQIPLSISRQAAALLKLAAGDELKLTVATFQTEPSGDSVMVFRESGTPKRPRAYFEVFSVGPRGAVKRLSRHFQWGAR